MKRYYRVTGTGEWFQGWSQKVGAEFRSDSTEKAVRVAAALNVAGVEVVEVDDNTPDPRTGTLLVEPQPSAPDPDELPLTTDERKQLRGLLRAPR